MEDQVYDGIDDYLRYVRRWVKRYDTPLTANSIKEYGSAVWNKWLARRYGRAIVRGAWARAVHTKPGGFSVAAYDSAIEAAGGSDFSRDFARFAARPARVAHRLGLPRGPTPTRTSPARAACRSAAGCSIASSTTPPSSCCACTPAAGGRSSSRRCAPRGIAAGLALVGRTGSERHGRVVSMLDFSRNGGRMTVRLAHGRGASSASPRCWSTPTPAPRASAPAGSTGPT